MMRRQEAGMVSLITAIIMALLLLVLTVSLVTLMTGEQRQATDSDQSVKAYYAAMSGVEDAIQQIKNDLSNPPYKIKPSTQRTPPCGGGSGGVGSYLDPPLNATRWTCQAIQAGANTANLTIPKDNDAQFRFPVAGGFNPAQMRIDWNSTNSTTEGKVQSGYTGPGNQFPNNTSVTGWTFPAVLEITLVSYPSGPVVPANVTSNTLVVMPDPAPANALVYNIASPTNPISGGCTTVGYFGGYNCYVDLKNFTNGRNYVVVIHPRYQTASVQVASFSHACGFVSNGAKAGYSNCNSAPQYNGSAQIDVTGQSGSAFRRVIENITLIANSAAGLDFSVFSDTNICKDYGVSVGKAILFGGCPDDTNL